jgi:hypothetical protein
LELFLKSIANFQTLLACGGLLLLVVALVSPIQTKWGSLTFRPLQRSLVGVVGLVLLGVAIWANKSPEYSLTFKYQEILFHDVRGSGAALPKSSGAAFCALTHVDDDSPAGYCHIDYDKESHEWKHQTGDGGSGNECRATCVWITPK